MNELPLNLSDASGVPYYRQLFDQIEGLIRSGQLPAGAPLPSVRELARQTLVSLITIRRAYGDLAQAGLIVQQQGRGTFVAEGIAGVSEARARADAEEALVAAVTQALQAGVEAEEIRQHVDEALSSLIQKEPER